MRNFWIETDIDGRKSPLRGGARNKNGEMTTHLNVKTKEGSVQALQINCFPETINKNGDQILNIMVKFNDGSSKLIYVDEEGNLVNCLTEENK